ncbi:MAG: benzoate/H(+) symporter BenE family transporter [Aestuariivirga sp.]
MNSEKHWPSLTAAGLAAVVVGFASTILIIMQAADGVGASDAQKISWAATLCFAMGGLTLWLSWRHRMPMIIAWSTPGAALMAHGAPGISYAQALGCFAVAGLLMVATGLLKPLATAIAKIPVAVASAMLAGVLLTYVLKVPVAATALPMQVLPLIIVFFAMRMWRPFYAVPAVVMLGLGLAAAFGNLNFGTQVIGFSRLTFDVPEFAPVAIISLALPLYLVTMASQNLPGFAVLRASGYEPPVSSSLITTGLASIIMSPFAGPQVNMAAITASLATGLDAHPDPTQRWKVAIPYVLIYAGVGLAAGVCVKVLGSLSPDLVHAIAGLALFGPLLGAMVAMMKEPADIEAALVTFLVTAADFNLFGVGSAFWGLVAGLVIWGIKKMKESA